MKNENTSYVVFGLENKAYIMVGPCPFGKEKQDLSLRKYIDLEKLWFEEALIDKSRPPVNLANQFNL